MDDNGKCTKGFPKFRCDDEKNICDCIKHTIHGEDTYPTYRRRCRKILKLLATKKTEETEDHNASNDTDDANDSDDRRFLKQLIN